MTGTVLGMSHDVEGDEDAGGMLNTGGKENGGVGAKNGCIYSSSCDFFIQHVSLFNEHKTAQPASCRTTRPLTTRKPLEET
jgi:hypothetical protein